jgi:cyclopropane-fatty-acyl-phospholipid synthase
MNSWLRGTAAVKDALLYGPEYAVCRYLIRDPNPHDPALLWQGILQDFPPAFDWFRRRYPPTFLKRFLLARRLRQDHAVGIEDHYDVSNAFYGLFLDKKYMLYSCADFHQDEETLEEAQTHKVEFLLDLIDSQPGERILELGCGWGGMMRSVIERTGDKQNLVGYTLSKNQVAYIRERYGFRVELKNFVTCDYERHAFDKIYSIGSWEAVRHDDLDVVLRKLYQALRPGGRLVQHFFCSPSEVSLGNLLAVQLFFPGHYTPIYSDQMQAFENAGFRVVRRTIHDYRLTLRAWYERLAANRDRVIELVGIETYNKWLVFFAISWRYFCESNAMLLRFVCEKSS